MSEKLNERYEYTNPTPLSGLSASYISIPESIIFDTSIDSKRVSVFSYLFMRKGMDNVAMFTIPSLVIWNGNKPDSHIGQINEKYINIINILKNKGYLSYEGTLSKTSCIGINFNYDKVCNECKEQSFAIVYLDELYTIMNYKKKEKSDIRLSTSVVLLVFAFLRSSIYRRSNKLRPEEINVDGSNNIEKDIIERKKIYPEAYDCRYIDIAKMIGIPSNTISKAVDILKQLGLIVTDEGYRRKNKNGEYRTPNIIFANAYKREDKYLLASGEEYSRAEIEQKVKKINRYFGGCYIINKNKRKKENDEQE